MGGASFASSMLPAARRGGADSFVNPQNISKETAFTEKRMEKSDQHEAQREQKPTQKKTTWKTTLEIRPKKKTQDQRPLTRTPLQPQEEPGGPDREGGGR